MRADIRKRLAEIEAKHYKPDRLDVFIVPALNEEAVVGFSLDGSTVALRGPDESLEALQVRAAAAVTDNRPAAIFRSLY